MVRNIENLPEKASTSEGKYSKTIAYFEKFMDGFSQIPTEELLKDNLGRAKVECKQILETLRSGEPQPAKDKIKDMLQINKEILSTASTEELNERENIIRELSSYLDELEVGK